MNEIIVLRISDDNNVLLDGMTLNSTNEVAEVLEKLRAKNPDATISIEADDPVHYEAIGKAIYGTQRAGFNVEHLRILVGGKLLGT
ncbi:biopolymer transporter ExbD [Duganella sp. HH101]|uniref:ExbD/TolR family protein n=1 Tax=Duganella sp. HH101 TaxID=1781066 RepID=UPI000874FC1A|nr:biopolymer transporter ExbD [Duganella sp. HH101]